VQQAGNVYVYAIPPAAAAGTVPGDGVAGSPVRLVLDGDLAALVSDLDGDAPHAAREVRAHWRVVEEASKHATVIPVRFGTVMAGDDDVRDNLLAPEAEQLAELLGELRGRVQLTVKGTYDDERLLREVVDASGAIGALRRRVGTLPEAAGYYDRIRLGELVAAEVARHREEDSRLAMARLGQVAIAGREEPAGGPDAAFNLSFLVARDGVDAFGAAVGELRRELGDRVVIRYLGPLPPYSFAGSPSTGGGPRWA
jgi:hypothetical protein